MQRNLEALDRRNRGRQADGEPRDFPTDREISLEVRCRNRQDVSEVVEAAVGRLISRQFRRHLDIEGKQIADRVVVFDAIEPMDRADPPGVRVRRPCAIDRGFERRGDRVIGGRVGPRHPCRRHRPRAKLGDDALPDLGSRSRIGDVDAFEHKAGGVESLAVAGNAVLVDEGLDRRPLDLRLGLRPEPLARGKRLNAGQRNGHPATDDEREDRGTAFHCMCARAGMPVNCARTPGRSKCRFA